MYWLLPLHCADVFPLCFTPQFTHVYSPQEILHSLYHDSRGISFEVSICVFFLFFKPINVGITSVNHLRRKQVETAVNLSLTFFLQKEILSACPANGICDDSGGFCGGKVRTPCQHCVTIRPFACREFPTLQFTIIVFWSDISPI